MKILVTGWTGGLGKYVIEALKDHTLILPQSREALNLLSPNSIISYIDRIKPERIVHLGAIANVDYCEDHPEEAVVINSLSTAIICSKMPFGSVIFMSTNDVFSGYSFPGPYGKITPTPTNVYSWTKFASECSVLSSGGLIIRANFFTRKCKSKQSFAEYVISGLRAGQKTRCYSNIFNSPVFAGTIADTIAMVVRENRRSGILHVACSEGISRFDFAISIAKAYSLDTGLIVNTKLTESEKRGRPLDARITSDIINISLDNEIRKMKDAEL